MCMCVCVRCFFVQGEWKWRKGADWKGFVMLKHGHFVEGKTDIIYSRRC